MTHTKTCVICGAERLGRRCYTEAYERLKLVLVFPMTRRMLNKAMALITEEELETWRTGLLHYRSDAGEPQPHPQKHAYLQCIPMRIPISAVRLKRAWSV